MTPTVVSKIAHMGSDRFVAYNGWLSTGKHAQAYTCPEEDVDRFIRFLMRGARRSKPMRRPHASPFGHPHLTVLVDDIPLFAAVHWWRHRTQNFSAESFRYGDLDTGAALEDLIYLPDPQDVRTQEGYPGDYTFPPLLDINPVAVDEGRAIVWESAGQAIEKYRRLIELGWAPELARTILPVGTLTTFTATASLRNWLNFLVLRATEPELESQAQLEIRQPADDVERIIAGLFPITYKAWVDHDRPIL